MKMSTRQLLQVSLTLLLIGLKASASASRDSTYNVTLGFKNASRSRLWSPYSTLGSTLELEQNDNSSSEEIDRPKDTQYLSNNETTPSRSADQTIAQPVISSIRHYRSRKSFSRTRKPGSSTTTEFSSVSGSEAFDAGDNYEDYQNDAPASPTPVTSTRGPGKGKGRGRKGKTPIVYGIPTLVQEPVSANDSSSRELKSKKLNRIKSFLLRNSTTASPESPLGPISNKKVGASDSNTWSTLRKHDLTTPSRPEDQVRSSTDRKGRARGIGNLQIPQSDSHTSVENDSPYEEIPLVFIPGVIPNFDQGGSHEMDKLGGPEDYDAERDYDERPDGTLTSDSTTSENEEKSDVDMDIVTKFLRFVEEKKADNCTAGTDLTLGQGVVDRYAQERFRDEAELAVNRANMLTRLWKYASDVMQNEYLLHASVFSMVEFDDDIFAAGNCYDNQSYKNYTLFCPFAYRLPEGTIRVKDLAVEYKYLTNTSEFFYVARKNAERVIKNFNQFTRGYHSYTYNESTHTDITEELILNVTYEDGKWSKPYFDCGGGNIWMMTYTVPFFDYRNGTYFFKGTSGIDIDLRRVDIDQCPLPENSTELNIFAASDKCKNATTKCVALMGLGFRRGSYRCQCRDGFYFPNVSSPIKYFNGSLLEEEYENKFLGRVSRYDEPGAYECLLCPYGCDTCVDDRPCVVSLNWLMRTGILALQCVIILMLPIVGLFTWKYSEVKVVRAASPVLLRFIVLGAFFIYCTILVMYPSPSVITCTLRVWLREIGFSLAYGALMLKTWRISVIFRVRSAKAVKITDLDLMKRLGIIVGMFTALLVIRTLVAPPVSIVSLTSDDLKAWLCKSDWWDHSFTIMELLFLVWGIRLCIVVRKAPSEFNESKFISLAIYNEFLLSLFLNISMLFLQSPANPDLLYIIFFCHCQLTMTLLLSLIFISKAYMVFRGHGKGAGSDETRVPTSKFITKSRSGGGAPKQPSFNALNSTAGTAMHSSISTIAANPPAEANSNTLKLPEDVQDEFRRLYFQLEELKERNMRLGNRHLVAKITAMQEAADSILLGSALPLQQQCPSPKPSTLQLANALEQKLLQIHPKTPDPPNGSIPSPANSTEPSTEVLPPPVKLLPTDDEDELEYMDVGEDVQVVDVSAQETTAAAAALARAESVDCHAIPVTTESSIPQGIVLIPNSLEAEETVVEAGTISISKNSSNSNTKGSRASQGQGNHTGSGGGGGNTSAKIILDLDDKSRFTEEITV